MIEKIPCRAVIFDFDGTLADSMPFLEKIGVQVMMRNYPVTFEEATKRYRSTTGLPYEQQIKLNFPNDEHNETAISEFEKLKIDRIFDQELFPDTEATLKRIKDMGIDVFVSSSTFQSTIEEYFRRKGLAGAFVEILGYRPGFEKGAHHFNHVKSKYNIPLNEVVFVGDSLKDYERSRGFCKFIGVERMFSQQDFRKVGHTGPVVRQLSQVPPLLKSTSIH
jgi:phosphoglycolate phosphatase-like HAD superfamily hydrolase